MHHTENRPDSWYKSSFSQEGQCVQVAAMDGAAAMRDSKHPDGGLLSFAPAEWAVFIAVVADNTSTTS
jgi:Domain of unknown function (DUF397)